MLTVVANVGGRSIASEVVRVRIHTDCEACREEARDKADLRVNRKVEAQAGPEPALGPGARDALFRSRVEPGGNADGLSEEERQLVEQLSARDREVRRHEEAHARVGGQYAGQPSYTYQTGPDGKRYAIGGEVAIDIAPIPDDPEATIEKMQIVKSAALAPAEPSAADRRVAALADAQRLVALAELSAMRQSADAPGVRPDTRSGGFAALAEIVKGIGSTETGGKLSKSV